MIALETRRLVLRELSLADAPEMCKLNADRLMMRDMVSPEDNSVEAERSRLSRYIAQAYHTDGFGIWATVLRETDEIIGRCGLRPQRIEAVAEIEITYQIASTWWGHGVATEAALAIRDYAFVSLGICRLIALIAPDNIASRRVAEKIGMHLERNVAWRDRAFDLFAILHTTK